MNLTGAIILFAVIWFLVFFVVLPIRFKSQSDAGHVVPGTPASAPAEENVLKKAKITTVIAAVLWAVIAGVVFSGAVSIRDLDWFGRLAPEAPAD